MKRLKMHRWSMIFRASFSSSSSWARSAASSITCPLDLHIRHCDMRPVLANGRTPLAPRYEVARPALPSRLPLAISCRIAGRCPTEVSGVYLLLHVVIRRPLCHLMRSYSKCEWSNFCWSPATYKICTLPPGIRTFPLDVFNPRTFSFPTTT